MRDLWLVNSCTYVNGVGYCDDEPYGNENILQNALIYFIGWVSHLSAML